MVNVLPTALGGVAVALFALALWNMARGELWLAGLSFLCASGVIYLRETRT